MKAARVHSFGGPDVVGIGDAATPKPQAPEVLVRDILPESTHGN